MPPSIDAYLLGVECKSQVCGSFFATPVQLSPDDYDAFEDRQRAYSCPRCGAAHTYTKGEHLFLLLDEAA